MFVNCRNSRKRGDVGLAAAIFWFAKSGYTVCVPLADSQDYDLIVERDGQMARVQVRTTTHLKRGAYYVNLRVTGGNRSGSTVKFFDRTRVDYLFAADGGGGQHLIPADQILARNLLCLGRKVEAYRVS